ncbi:MAG TPA: hypothetical protein ENK39_09555 [Epsilonproteobacteria bacterium]|nr:hypothetical protein [Campylobacterota bacterium]
MNFSKSKILLTIASFSLIACGGGGSSSTPSSSIDTTAPSFVTSNQVSVSENQTSVLKVQASDTSTVSYTISGGSEGSQFTINSFSGQVDFRTAPDFEVPTDLNGDNRYEVVITATDTSNNTSAQTLIVTVTDVVETTINKTITITTTPHVESLGKGNSINATVNMGNTPKTLYVLLSNDATSSATATITHNPKVFNVSEAKKVLTMSNMKNTSPTGVLKDLEDFKRNVHQLFSHNFQAEAKIITVPKRQEDVAGQSKVFKLDNSGSDTTTATARKIVSNVSSVFGTKTLNIWVSDDSFDAGSGCSKSKCVTQAMVDALASTFLQAGSDNDLYDWVSNVYGEEWGSNTNGISNMIGDTNEITILLTDISKDNNTNGGVLGFFHPKDNFLSTSVSGSNERIMFYADAVLFANGDSIGVWSIDDFWPKEMISTLAHEFQHMIHFYQKTILLTPNGDPTDTWINEMLAETTEDLVATKIKHTGSRGVAYTDGSAGSTGNTLGRYPLFNGNNTLSLTEWNSQLSDYSKVNAFGAFLIRNYGGAKILHDIMHNAFVDEQAVVDAVHQAANGTGKTFDDLLSEWGVAVLLSDNANLPAGTPAYNTGDFTLDTYSNSTYEIGSVNFFNYNPQPLIQTTSGTVEKQGNYYYKVGDNLTGTVTVSLTLSGQTEATLIAK